MDEAAPELGPFQDMWDAWEESRDELLAKPLSHYQQATVIQFKELDQHLKDDNYEAAGREAADVISIALNMLRWLGYSPKQISEIARSRAAVRMRGQTTEILEKYQRLYGI